MPLSPLRLITAARFTRSTRQCLETIRTIHPPRRTPLGRSTNRRTACSVTMPYRKVRAERSRSNKCSLFRSSCSNLHHLEREDGCRFDQCSCRPALFVFFVSLHVLLFVLLFHPTGFIRKVYLTLMIQLLLTVGIICAFLYW